MTACVGIGVSTFGCVQFLLICVKWGKLMITRVNISNFRSRWLLRRLKAKQGLTAKANCE